MNRYRFSALSSFLLCLIAICLMSLAAAAQFIPTNDPPVYGPYNAIILQGGDGLRKQMITRDTVLRADSPWTIYGWVNTDGPITTPVLVAGVGDVAAEYSRYLGLDSGKLMLWMGADNSLSAPATLTPGKWQFVAATFDGTVFRLYSDGAQVGQGSLTLGRVAPVLQLAPPLIPSPTGKHFGGKIAGFTVTRDALTAGEIKQRAVTPPQFAILEYEDGSKPWPVQTHAQAGYRAPQDPSTMAKKPRAVFLSPSCVPGPRCSHRDSASRWRRRQSVDHSRLADGGSPKGYGNGAGDQ